MDTTDPRSHYWRAHYLSDHAAYLRRLADAKAARLAAYHATGQIRDLREFL